MPQVKKVTIKGIYGQMPLSKMIAAPGQRLHVATVIGIATSFEDVLTDLGPSVAMKGDFEGVNPETGEILRASVCYLPPIVTTALKVASTQSANGSVSFGVDIWAVYVAEQPGFRGGAPYEYTFNPIVPPTEETDPLLKLKAMYSKQVLALAAPPAEDKKAPAVAAKSAKK